MASYFSMAFNLNSSIFLGHSVPSTASLGFPQLHTFWRLKRLVILYVQKHQCVGGTRAGISCSYSYWTCLPFFTSIIGSTELNYIWRKRRTTKLTVALRMNGKSYAQRTWDKKNAPERLRKKEAKESGIATWDYQRHFCQQTHSSRDNWWFVSTKYGFKQRIFCVGALTPEKTFNQVCTAYLFPRTTSQMRRF